MLTTITTMNKHTYQNDTAAIYLKVLGEVIEFTEVSINRLPYERTLGDAVNGVCLLSGAQVSLLRRIGIFNDKTLKATKSNRFSNKSGNFYHIQSRTE